MNIKSSACALRFNAKFEILLNSLKGQVLHASTLGFIHPKNSKIMEFKISNRKISEIKINEIKDIVSSMFKSK